MYSIVVMAALVASSDAPDFGKGQGGCYGCYGYGCYSTSHSGWACTGCNGYACHGYSCSGWSCGGCYGSCYGGACYGGAYSCWGCYGCWGTSPYFQTDPSPCLKMPPADPNTRMDTPKKVSLEPERGRLVINVPADAKLYIDDQPMKATSEVRNFHTPILEKGATYYYILKVEVVRENTTYSETKRVLIRSGKEVKASFTETSIVAAGKAANTASR